MLKICGLTLTTVLLLGYTTCAERRESTITTTTATPTPVSTPTPAPTPTPEAPTTATVKVIENSDKDKFEWRDDASGTPVTTIKLRGKVTWINTGKEAHRLQRVNRTEENKCEELESSFNSTRDLVPNASVTRTFNKLGVFGYRCGIHGGKPKCKENERPGTSSGHEMPGVIVVVP